MEFTFTITEKYSELKRVNNLMLSNDEDYAQIRNNIGYNQGDTIKAHRLADYLYWSERDAIWIYNALNRYKRQLLSVHSIEYDRLVPPHGKGNEFEGVLTEEDLSRLEWGEPKRVNTKKGPRNVQRCINLPSRNDQKYLFWEVFENLYYSDVQKYKWVLGISIESPSRWNDFTKSLVRWTVAEVEIEPEPLPLIQYNPDDYVIHYGDYLLEYQPDHVKRLIYAYNLNDHSIIDGSDTGTGKTFCAIAMSLELGKKLFVICPKSVIPSWIEALKHFGITEDQINKEGGDHFIVNYELIRTGKMINMRYSTRTAFTRKHGIPKLMYDKVLCPFIKKEPYQTWNGKIKYNYKWNLPDTYLSVWDEVHRCKNIGTSNTSMLIGAKNSKCNILGMSATIAENPLKLRAIGYVIGLFPEEKGFWNWARDHGCDNTGWNGSMEFTQDPYYVNYYMKKLHNAIYVENKRGARMAIADLGDLFPETQIMSEIYNMNSDANKIQRTYDEMVRELDELRVKTDRDSSDSMLTIILRARQKIELLKVPTFVELIRDYIDSGNSVAVFVNFNQTIDAIAEKLSRIKKLKIPYPCVIRGGQLPEERQHWINQFQNNTQDVILCNINAGGVGISLHDKYGGHQRVSLISPNFSAQDLIQALGRVHRGGGQSKSIQRIIFCANTIEETICNSLRTKITSLNMLNDGDLAKGVNIHPQDFEDYIKTKKDIEKLRQSDDPEAANRWKKEHSVDIEDGFEIIL